MSQMTVTGRTWAKSRMMSILPAGSIRSSISATSARMRGLRCSTRLAVKARVTSPRNPRMVRWLPHQHRGPEHAENRFPHRPCPIAVLDHDLEAAAEPFVAEDRRAGLVAGREPVAPGPIPLDRPVRPEPVIGRIRVADEVRVERVECRRPALLLRSFGHAASPLTLNTVAGKLSTGRQRNLSSTSQSHIVSGTAVPAIRPRSS